MSKVRVITISRKPCSEPSVAANALKWGTGGINIDATRISLGNEAPPSTPQSNPSNRQGEVFSSEMWKGDNTKMHEAQQASIARLANLGRFPANLILIHKSECKKTGTRRMGAGEYTEPTGTRPGGFGNVGADKGNGGHCGPKYGTETVDTWECVTGCPVADLDKQSGVVATGTWNRQGDGAHPFGDAVGSPYENWKQVNEAPGGASRYFKQVGGRRDP